MITPLQNKKKNKTTLENKKVSEQMTTTQKHLETHFCKKKDNV